MASSTPLPVNSRQTSLSYHPKEIADSGFDAIHTRVFLFHLASFNFSIAPLKGLCFIFNLRMKNVFVKFKGYQIFFRLTRIFSSFQG